MPSFRCTPADGRLGADGLVRFESFDPEEWHHQHHPSAESFTEDEAGLLLPTPTGKQVSFLMFRGGLALHAEESKSELQRQIGHLRQTNAHWMEITDPQFGEKIPLSAAAIDDLLWIGDVWLDMKAAREQQKQREIASRLAGMGIQQGAPPVVLPNRAARRGR